MYRIISISGTPGTGKTDVAKLVSKELNTNLISISKLVKSKKVQYKTDRKRKTKIIDVKLLQKAVNKEIKKDKINIIEGHLSHFLKTDFIIILRTNPKILEKRLKKRNWGKSKILENVQAEILDEITIDAIQKHSKRKIIELDTTKKKPEQTTRTILGVLNNHSLQKKYSLGKIKWLKKYYKMLE